MIKSIPKYNLTKGINEKKYRSISEQVINDLPIIDDWISNNFIESNNLTNWNNCIKSLHSSKDAKDVNSKSFRRLVFMNCVQNS